VVRTELAHYPVHQVFRRPGQRLEFGGRLAVVNVVPAQDLQHQLVQAVAEVGHPGRERLLDQGSRRDVGWQPDVGGLDRSRRVEARVGRLHGEEVLQDAHEPAKV
jgi:hypothetical protein